MPFIKVNTAAIILLFIFFLLTIWLLHCEFHSAEQSKEISNTLLLNNNENNGGQFSQTKKVIFLLIDSAKYLYWQQYIIQSIKNLVQNDPSHSIIFKTKVSQPTMTTQKIETLMTGSEIFSSTSIIDAFFSTSVLVDNIVHQVNRKNGRTVTLGDDTWGKLFKFTVEYPCVSTFDIWDWESCDQIIYKNLIQQVQNRNQLTIAHFLALDHIGHASSSITHPQFKVKKQKISNFIKQIIQKMDDNQILFVTGDHGMRDDGNHGGGSPQQSESFLFFHSKKDRIKVFKQMNISEKQDNQEGSQPYIRQPDITTTLSLLLNIPIPKNSIGIPIFTLQSQSQGKLQQYVQYHHIANNLKLHFEKLIQKNNIQCEQNSQNFIITSQKQLIQEYKNLQRIQEQCLSHLSHNQPNITLIISILCAMGIVCLIFALVLQIQLIQYVAVLAIAIPHSFSWLLIRNSSTYYLITLMTEFLQKTKAKINRATFILVIVIICQFQPLKNGEYQVNYLYFGWLSNILTSPIFCIVFSMLLLISRIYSTLFSHHKQKKQENSRKYRDHEQKICLILFVLITLSYVLKQIKAVEYMTIINILIIFIVAFLLLYNSLVIKNFTFIPHIIKYFLLLFLGNYSIPFYFFILLIFQNIQSYSSRLLPYIAYLLAHQIWWILGNRYEYSSIDIVQSYIFSSGYHYLINPICLCIYMMAPYLFVLLLIYNREDQVHDKRNNKKQYEISIQSEQSDQQPQPTIVSKFRNIKIMDQFQQPTSTQYYKILLIPMVWIICCFINLTYNNEKILYTIAYVPMTVIEVAKILTLILITIVIGAVRSCIK